jgi:hypothetical protein
MSRVPTPGPQHTAVTVTAHRVPRLTATGVPMPEPADFHQPRTLADIVMSDPRASRGFTPRTGR